MAKILNAANDEKTRNGKRLMTLDITMKMKICHRNLKKTFYKVHLDLIKYKSTYLKIRFNLYYVVMS